MPVWSLRNTGIALYRVVSRKNNIVTCQTAFICLCDAHIFMRNQIIIRERRITNRAVAWGGMGSVGKTAMFMVALLHIYANIYALCRMRFDSFGTLRICIVVCCSAT